MNTGGQVTYKAAERQLQNTVLKNIDQRPSGGSCIQYVFQKQYRVDQPIGLCGHRDAHMTSLLALLSTPYSHVTQICSSASLNMSNNSPVPSPSPSLELVYCKKTLMQLVFAASSAFLRCIFGPSCLILIHLSWITSASPPAASAATIPRSIPSSLFSVFVHSLAVATASPVNPENS